MAPSIATELYVKLRFLPLFLGIFVLTPEGIFLCGLIIYLLYRYKIARIAVFCSFVLFYTAVFLLAWWHYRAPWGWKRYIDLKGRYSFAYPGRLILTRCGNGEVVVAKVKLTECFDPRIAPQDYIDNLYLQTFLPRQVEVTDTVAFADPNNDVPKHPLKDWNIVEWRENDLALFTSHRRMQSGLIPAYQMNEPLSFSFWDTPVGRTLQALLLARKREYDGKTVFPERFAIGRAGKSPEEQKEFNTLLDTVCLF